MMTMTGGALTRNHDWIAPSSRSGDRDLRQDESVCCPSATSAYAGDVGGEAGRDQQADEGVLGRQAEPS